MTWRTEIQSKLFNTGNDLNDENLNVVNLFNDISSTTCAEVKSSLSNFNLIGINANQIKTMQQEIISYIGNLETHLVQLKEDANVYQEKDSKNIDAYVVAITEICKAITSQLLLFSDQLREIEEAYNNQK